jgi:20S proteasome subunit beta 2
VDALVRKVKFIFWRRGVLEMEGCGVGNGVMGSEIGGKMGTTASNWGREDDIMMTTSAKNEDDEVPSASVPAILHYIRTTLQKSRGSLGVNLLVGGYDDTSRHAHLAAIHPHGSMDVVNYAALGSGGLAATGVLESRYPMLVSERRSGEGGGCTVEEGIQLAVDAVRAGINNDLGSGSQVDVCVISREGVLYRRAVVREEEIDWVSVGADNDDSSGGGGVLEVPNLTVEEKDIVLSAGGVNGFGNVPFAIQSKRMVSGGQLAVERERRRWLDELLGGCTI